MQNIQEILERLNQNNVQFVLIGGFAAIVHGVTLVTRDVDFCIPFSEENCDRLLKALDGLNPVHRMTQQKMALQETAASLAKFKNLYLLTKSGVIDFLGFVGGLGTFEKVVEQSVMMELFRQPCRVLNIEALIKAKKSMSGAKDIQTVFQLEAIKEKLQKK